MPRNQARQRQDETRSTKIAIWGPKAAGKTTYITVLYHSREDSGWKMKAADEKSDTFRLNNYKTLFGKGEFPIPTPISPKDVQALTFDLSRERLLGKEQSFRLVFLEASGEWYDNPVETREKYPLSITPYDWLAQCQGLVLLLDPIEVSQDQVSYYVMISRTLGMLRRVADESSINRPILPYLAICFTKMDNEACRKHISLEGEKMYEYAKRMLSKHTIEDIEQACDPGRVEFFGCSAIGWLEDAETGEKVSNIAKKESGQVCIKYPNKINPVNIFRPIEWLLDNLPPE